MKKTKARFIGTDCFLEFAEYGNKRKAISLITEDTKELMAVATVNLPNEPCGDDEVFIKDYSENEGILALLIEIEVISKPIGFSQSGWVQIPKCKLLKTN